MINFIKRHKPRLLLSLLLAFHVSLILVQAKNLEGTSLLKVGLIALNAPIIRAIERGSQGIGHLCRKYIYLTGLYDENQALKRQVLDLKLQVWKDAEITSENRRLTQLLRLKEQLPFRVEGARVVIKKPPFFAHTIFIDKGYNYGLRKDMPVISAEGIVGDVKWVSLTLSEVRLITNSGAAANATIEARGVRGVINGTGDEWLVLKYVRAEEAVAPGDLVTTFGMDGIYPKGLPIGTVVDVRPGPGLHKEIKVKSAADIRRLEEVLLLLDK